MGLKVSQFNTGYHYGATYSGSDMVVFMAFPGYKPIEIGSISTLSYTVFREKKQVRTLGRISPKGITKGPRTISGKMIFTVMHEHIAETLRKEIPYLSANKIILMDELPPFDLIVSFGNEYGKSAGLVIQGVTTVDELKTLSIEELFTENIFTYLARRLEPMRDTSIMNGKWDPLNIHTSQLRSDNSELIGRFTIDELILTDYARRLKDYDPFINPAQNWEVVFPDISTDAIEVGNGNFGGSKSGTTGGGGFDTSPTPKGKKTFHVTVLGRNGSDTDPLSGAKVVVNNGELTVNTDNKGVANFTVDEDLDRVRIVVTKSGYKKSDYYYPIQEGDWIQITLDEEVRLDQEKYCTNDPDARDTAGYCVPYGYWYDKGATSHFVTPTQGDGDPQYFPDVTFKVLNWCKQPMANHKVYIEYEILNWDQVKNNKCWKDTWLPFSCIGQVSKKKNGIGFFTTDGNGKCTAVNFFDFGLFPAEANVKITAKPLNRRDSPSHDLTGESSWASWYFQLSKK